MSQAKFTKGLWKVHGDWMIIDSTERLIAQFEPLNDDISNGNTAESFANAYLIAAAPEMYDFIEYVAKAHLKEGTQVHSDAMRLLAKARGEQ